MTPHAAALKKELDEKEARLKKEQRELDERREIFEAQRSSGAGLKLATQDVMERIKRATQNRDALTNDIEMVEIQIAAAEKKLKEKPPESLPSQIELPSVDDLGSMTKHVEALRDQLQQAQLEIELEAKRAAQAQARTARRENLREDGAKLRGTMIREDEAFVRDMIQRLHDTGGRIDVRTPRGRPAR